MESIKSAAIDKVVQIKCQGAEMIDMELIKEFQGDFKTLTKENFEKLKHTIVTEGFCDPINVWREGANLYCLDGHQRLFTLKALKADGWLVPKLPVNYVKAKDREEAKKLILTFSSNYGAISEESLSNFMIDAGLDVDFLDTSVVLPEVDFNYFTGEDGSGTEGMTDPDDVPEVKGDPKVRLGDVFTLGVHRLMCGDSTNPEDVARLMNGTLADMVFTDPPYNIGYEGGSKKREMIKNDIVEDFYSFLFKMYQCVFSATKPGAAIYVTHADTERVNFTKAFVDAGFHLSSVIIWVKNNSTFGRQDYFWKHEPMLYGWNSMGGHKWHGPNTEDTVWCIDRPSRSEEHPTMKPVELIERALSNSSLPGDSVVDVFGGSGTTLLACEKTGRKAYLNELDPHYCSVIIERWQQFTGKEAVREDGVKYNDIVPQ